MLSRAQRFSVSAPEEAPTKRLYLSCPWRLFFSTWSARAVGIFLREAVSFSGLATSCSTTDSPGYEVTLISCTIHSTTFTIVFFPSFSLMMDCVTQYLLLSLLWSKFSPILLFVPSISSYLPRPTPPPPPTYSERESHTKEKHTYLGYPTPVKPLHPI
jgi:hypothetical protein